MTDTVYTDDAGAARAPLSPTRPFYWSLRRELWEHRAVWMTPLVVAAFAAAVHFITVLVIPDSDRAASLADPAKAREFMALYDAACGVVVISGIIVGMLYCAGALHGERRDRSLLFWKSLPVSDRTAVLAKAAVPMIVLPLAVFFAVVAATMVMITLQTLAWRLDGFDPRELWSRVDLPFLWASLAYGLPFMALWYAPVYAWLLFVSGWAQRQPLLWGLAPFAAILIVEHVALGHTHIHWMLERWFAGGVMQPYARGGDFKDTIQSLAELEPLRIWTLPTLWVGLALAVLFLAAAVRMRRDRGPI
jgi:ABC-2 type transport system permease protein